MLITQERWHTQWQCALTQSNNLSLSPFQLWDPLEWWSRRLCHLLALRYPLWRQALIKPPVSKWTRPQITGKAKAKLVSSRPMMLLPVNVNYIFRRGHNWIWNLIRILHLRLCFQLQHSFGQSFLLNYFQWWAGPGLTWEYCKNDDKLRIMCFITLSPIGLSANSDFLQDPKMRNIRNNDTSK